MQGAHPPAATTSVYTFATRRPGPQKAPQNRGGIAGSAMRPHPLPDQDCACASQARLDGNCRRPPRNLKGPLPSRSWFEGKGLLVVDSTLPWVLCGWECCFSFWLCMALGLGRRRRKTMTQNACPANAKVSKGRAPIRIPLPMSLVWTGPNGP